LLKTLAQVSWSPSLPLLVPQLDSKDFLMCNRHIQDIEWVLTVRPCDLHWMESSHDYGLVIGANWWFLASKVPAKQRRLMRTDTVELWRYVLLISVA